MSEPDATDLIATAAIERWTTHGLECAVAPGRHCLNGYVRLPAGHPALVLAGALATEEESGHEVLDTIGAHGRLTYGPDEHGWTGFDTGHVFDWWAVDDLIGRIPEVGLAMARTNQQFAHEYASLPYRRWSYDRLRKEVERLAESLASYGP